MSESLISSYVESQIWHPNPKNLPIKEQVTEKEYKKPEIWSSLPTARAFWTGNMILSTHTTCYLYSLKCVAEGSLCTLCSEICKLSSKPRRKTKNPQLYPHREPTLKKLMFFYGKEEMILKTIESQERHNGNVRIFYKLSRYSDYFWDSVSAGVWGTELIPFIAALAVLHQDGLKNIGWIAPGWYEERNAFMHGAK